MRLSEDTLLFSPKYSTPRRSLAMPSLSHAPPILPLTNSPLTSRRLRSTSRRLSYTVKNRAGRYAVPLSVGSVIALVFLMITWSRTPARHYPSHRVKLYTREQIEQVTFGTPSQLTDPYDNAHAPRPGRRPGATNGVSSLVESEAELIAEDDLFWMNYKEPAPMTEKEKASNRELEAHRHDVIERNVLHSLKALIWWMAEGGEIPNGWDAPPKSYFDKFGSRGMERLLNGIDQGKGGRSGPKDRRPVGESDMDSVFRDGWGDAASKELKLVVFSKTYCGFSRRAKAILSKYTLSPEPYIIELDLRSDTGAIQNLLFHLTGRRTVPNVILDFKSLGGADELTLLDSEGGLQRKLKDAGLTKPERNEYAPYLFADEADDFEDLKPEDREHVEPLRDPKVKAPPVDIAAAVRQAHQAVDQREGYGQFQGADWHKKLLAELYDQAAENTPDGKENEKGQARHGGDNHDGPRANRGDFIDGPMDDRHLALRDNIPREQAQNERADGVVLPVERAQAQDPIDVEVQSTNNDAPHSESFEFDPWGGEDPWSQAETETRGPKAQDTEKATLDASHPSLVEKDVHSEDSTTEGFPDFDIDTYDYEPREYAEARRYEPHLDRYGYAPVGRRGGVVRNREAVARDQSSTNEIDERFILAPEPRQVEEDGIAALSAAANLRRRPNGRKLRTVLDDPGTL